MRAYNYLQNLLWSFVEQKGFSWSEKAVIEPPKDKQFGDMATNLALVLSGQARKKPRDLAQEIVDEIKDKAPDIEKIEIAGPGFLNFTFAPGFWQKTVLDILDRTENYGKSDMGQGRKVQVEFVSANPTGPLHIGHGRGAAVGDSLTRVLRATGHEVSTEYYINDAGRQMRLLGQSVLARARQILGEDVEFPEECYKGEYIKEIAKDLLAEHEMALLEKSETDRIALGQKFAMRVILADIQRDLKAFRVEHEVWFSEKSLIESKAVDKTFKRLRKDGLAYEKDGALWFRATDFGDEKDRVLVKSSGELTYFASDIAYHDHKFNRGFDLLVDIWGADHHGYAPRIKGAVRALGKSPESLEIILVQLVNLLRGGEQVAMSTRAGEFETLSDVCAEVGVDAARFIFLSRKSDSHLDFDLELVKQQSMENPVYYVQYAHARICSVMRKAKERNIHAGDPSAELLAALGTPEDLELLRLLEQFPDTLSSAAKYLSPHYVSFYLMDLATCLHRYYTVHQVLAAGEDGLVRARMFLISSVAQVIRNGLFLLGVDAPERM
ncbi:MAG: arginine--tRNA ligase [Thermodesulfobacteriota bacterium]|nr:arginine--tRNA ligase [Thermodesulfobacteriota bacterium]